MTSVKHKFVVGIADDAADALAGKVVSSNWNDEHSVSLVAADILALGFITSASVSSMIAAIPGSSLTLTIDLLVVTNAQFNGSASFAGPVSFAASVSFSASIHFSLATISTLGVTGTASFADIAIFGTSAKVSATLSVGFLQIGGHNFNISLSQSVSTGQVLTYNNVDNKWRNVTPASGTTLAGLIDVSLSQSVATGQVLTYNNADNKWRNVTPVASSGKLDGTTGFAGVNFFKMSADWTAYQALELDVQAKGAATTTNLIIALYTDGGTTPILTFATNPIASATASEVAASFQITGTRNQNAMKVIFTRYQMFNGVTNQAGQFPTSTFTVSAINAIGVITGAGTTTTTMSSADIFLYGRGA